MWWWYVVVLRWKKIQTALKQTNKQQTNRLQEKKNIQHPKRQPDRQTAPKKPRNTHHFPGGVGLAREVDLRRYLCAAVRTGEGKQ